MNKHFIILLFYSLLLCPTTSKAQEVLHQLETRPQKNGIPLKSAIISSEKASLSFIFFDDFSTSNSTLSKNWLNYENVYINDNYALNPPSIGTATFDALDKYGVLYEQKVDANNVVIKTVQADKLTSVPIDLSAYQTNGVYLSFFYQPQGRNYIDAPESNDSLILDFYNPVLKKMDSAVWVAKGEKQTKFKQVVIHITNIAYLQNNFQFQFRNTVSYDNNSDELGKKSNCDVWQVDYIKICQNKEDTITNDVAIVEPLHSMLNNYEAIPWKHFKDNEAALSELSDNIYLTVRNNSVKETKIDRLYHLREKISNGPTSTFGKDALNLKGDTTQTLEIERTVSFESANQDSAIFELRAEIGTGPKDIKSNDTARYYQVFKNFYAYDDGSAEAGYGLSGSGTKNARVALQFNTFLADTLQAIGLYFNQVLNAANKKAFKLTIWNNDNGKPGEIIHSQLFSSPIYADELNKYSLYQLDKPLFLEKGIYYIGWIQNYEEFLNIGYDINTNSSSKLFYNIDGEWVNSNLKGSIMLRAYVGSKQEVIHTDIDENTDNQKISLYPNPATDYCQVNFGSAKIKEIKVFDITGRIQQIAYNTQGRIETSNLKPGVYLIHITLNSKTTTLRLVITR